jgi:hypothetical protein
LIDEYAVGKEPVLDLMQFGMKTPFAPVDGFTSGEMVM